MTDRFVVPEPSAAAIASTDEFPVDAMVCYLRAAYAVDVPAIVKAECERLVRECRGEISTHIYVGNLERWIAARFGEAEPFCGMCQTPGCKQCFPPRSAPSALEMILKSQTVIQCGMCGETRLIGQEHECKVGYITPAERAFLRALAEWTKANVFPVYTGLHYAARRVVEEDK